MVFIESICRFYPSTPIYREIGPKLASTVVTVTTVDPPFLLNFTVNSGPNWKVISDLDAERHLGKTHSQFCPFQS